MVRNVQQHGRKCCLQLQNATEFAESILKDAACDQLMHLAFSPPLTLVKHQLPFFLLHVLRALVDLSSSIRV